MNQLQYNGSGVFGVRPGNRFFCPLPISGSPTACTAEVLPDGVELDSVNGILSGCIAKAGRYRVELQARNATGSLRFSLDLLCGEDIFLTPPMAWNSWYCFSESVSDAKIRQVAAAIRDRGLAAHGWNSINIDDCWQGKRGGRFNALQGNERFPDMAGLVKFVHSCGLRFGLYSTPWLSTYAGFRGGSADGGFEERCFLPPAERLQPEQVYGRFPGGRDAGGWRTGTDWLMPNDIAQWAEWGVDYVKIDWCPNDIPTTRRIAAALRGSGRDIALSLSNTAPAAFAPELLAEAQVVRITGDIQDNWESLERIGFHHDEVWYREMKPGHWADPDMLQIGAIGIPNEANVHYKPSRLTAEEQQLQFSLWCMLSAPLILSCDIAGMDDKTFALLTNDDVLAIQRDPLAAAPLRSDDGAITRLEKRLADGGQAVGYFNRSETPLRVTVCFDAPARELWNGTQLESGISKEFEIPSHGVVLFRVNG